MRVRFADTTLVKAPEGIADQALVLLADIFPTGRYGVRNALKDMTEKQLKEATIAIIGCGFVSPTMRRTIVLTYTKTSGPLCGRQRRRSKAQSCTRSGLDPVSA